MFFSISMEKKLWYIILYLQNEKKVFEYYNNIQDMMDHEKKKIVKKCNTWGENNDSGF